ncbi:hypothetical protein [Comamonas testosteroni]|uniref:Lipoprotein n=1 Tax=Comamonas testosteroni TaxID=285 RepID=A0A096FDK6_COMTE|nr:hypothetical protein [Comamonas testosteroni]KGH27878.1 hypothetical protein P353_17585 [Comamonas testosteroni]
MYRVLAVLVAVALAGCAGKVDYFKPGAVMTTSGNSKTLNKSKDDVWKTAVPELGKQFFVINNIDKDSGLINISYSGDPEKYVDCGRVVSFVKNSHGERIYDFAGSKASQQYEIMVSPHLFNISRQMNLDGRMNLVFEEVEQGKTRVSANTRYVVERKFVVVPISNGIPQSMADSVSFNTGTRGAFQLTRDGQGTECIATGTLEQEVLSLIK